VNRVNVGTAIEQQRDDVTMTADDGAMQRVTAGPVHVSDQFRLDIDEPSYA
jgi:hypothetical protein